VAQLLGPVSTLLALLPALAANGAPVLLKRRGTPVDGGRRLWDGRPVLGPGKTWEGLAIGLLYGAALASLLGAASCRPIVAYAGTIASLGALAGDMAAAFVKRRLGLERGAPAPLLDQWDFYAGALVALYAAHIIVDPWVAAALAPLVLLLHRATNRAAYRLRLKPVPW
jgi:CDP-2,3-bis-(O-geranylgeranyl)-sn-glycerol synthase